MEALKIYRKEKPSQKVMGDEKSVAHISIGGAAGAGSGSKAVFKEKAAKIASEAVSKPNVKVEAAIASEAVSKPNKKVAAAIASEAVSKQDVKAAATIASEAVSKPKAATIASEAASKPMAAATIAQEAVSKPNVKKKAATKIAEANSQEKKLKTTHAALIVAKSMPVAKSGPPPMLDMAWLC